MPSKVADTLKGEYELEALIRSIRLLVRELRRANRRNKELNDDDEEGW